MTANLYTAEQVRELDRTAIEDHGIDGFQLMQKAARFAFHTLTKTWPKCDKIHVFCGNWNNAGDGYILAGLAINRGFEVKLHYLSPPKNLKNDALRAYQYSQENKVSCKAFSNTTVCDVADDTDFIIIDAILGTGLNSEVRGEFKLAINLCNQSKAPILSIDIPSGLSANTGQALGVAIKAHCTATFIGLKQGMFTGAGRNYCGDIFYDELGITTDIFFFIKRNCKHFRIYITYINFLI